MGGRGASSSTGRASGANGSAADIKSLSDMISFRGTKRAEVDAVLSVARDLNNRYGAVFGDLNIAELKKGKSQTVLGFFDPSDGSLAMNKAFFDESRMRKAMDDCIKSGWHPSRGKKTAIEAVAAHEGGHKITEMLQGKIKPGQHMSFDETATYIVKQARAKTKHRGVVKMSRKISEYATVSNAEAIAEAFTDVYCNGNKAKSESKAIMSVIDSYF